MRVAVLAGGFGGARMAHGFALLGDGVDLTVVVNTADDLVLHGLDISPDLDTVMYTLAGLANSETGWGVRDETWSASAMLERYDQPAWFRLGDRDLATHVLRTMLLRDGRTLTEVTGQLSRALGVRPQLLPMSDDPVRTLVRTAEGWLDFQDYFVKRHHDADVLELRLDGVAEARPSAQVLDAVAAAELVVIAPSNPFVSVGPILALPGLLDALRTAKARVVSVSPIIGGAAVRGPAAAMLRSLANETGSAGVARHYSQAHPGLIDVFVIDEADAGQAGGVTAAGFEPYVTGTLLPGEDDRRRLAAELIALPKLGAAG
jgi:LPPG:FO 2-phospho-L-lactate transferase